MTTYSTIHTAVTAGKVMQTLGCFICYHNECCWPFRCLRQGTCLTQTVSSWASWWTARTWPTPMSRATWTPPRWGGRNTERRCWDAFLKQPLACVGKPLFHDEIGISLNFGGCEGQNSCQYDLGHKFRWEFAFTGKVRKGSRVPFDKVEEGSKALLALSNAQIDGASIWRKAF